MDYKKWLYITVVVIIFSFIAPMLLTKISGCIEFDEKTGVIGDTIGGIMNPFISIAAVIVTGLAFYVQYQANDTVRNQFELQKIENQFYEMLRLHKENVNEIKVERTNNGIQKTISGREAFVEMKGELEFLLKLYEDELNEEIFGQIYSTFFWGYNHQRLESIGYSYKKSNIETISDAMEEETLYTKWRKKVEEAGCIPKGYHSCLGYYYRHLFHTVKFIVNKDEKLISEKQKLDYLRMLRAQLSNYEQEMLFYNWISGYGGDWENEDNKFFTQYKMIHNLWYGNLYGDDFIKQKLKDLVNMKGKDDLFEIGDNIDEKFS